LPEDPIVARSKVLPKGVVQIPLETRERLDLKRGTKPIVVAAGDGVVLQKAEAPVAKKGSMSIIQKIQSTFSKVPTRNIEERSDRPEKGRPVAKCR
jgi:bifunctional DNA-binding transcriptional regulator/antitoxin component of YhaV-PrlF toxin-antitoxin module